MTDRKFDGVTLDVGGMMGTHPNTDSYLLIMAKNLKKIFEKEAKERGTNITLGVAFTIFLNPSKGYNPFKGIHLNTWEDYSNYIDYLFIMSYETASNEYNGISPMNWLIEMLTPVFANIHSKHNLILGIPFYGHKKDRTTGKETAIIASDYMGYLSRLTENHPYKLNWSEVSCEHFLRNGNDFITYPTLNVSSTDLVCARMN